MPVFIVGVLSGCSALSKAGTKNPPVKEIEEKIKQAVDISNLKAGNYVKLKQLYGISRGEIEEFVLYRAPSNIKADEILLIKVKDASSVNGVKEKILKRAEKQAASFRDYLPEEYFLIEKKEILVKNNYILFAISKDAQKIANVFEECF
ncbi:DUF4358 domain-containing protein [Desulfolucanica intricata]|uniref:DUF4358 domain-containing protein n=1 Tax=Desulfolucanica intricata TaxID=1285191 RepID=UPI001EE4ACD5|nr:DUF4358 domain-containing protein [Desulfolucanica intricata]